MKTKLIALIFLAFISSCQKQEQNNPEHKLDTQKEAPKKKSSNQYSFKDIEARIEGDVKGNYIWSAAPSIAWNTMTDSLLHGPATFKGLSDKLQKEVSLLNASKTTLFDLGTQGCLAMCEIGQPGMRKINKTLNEKFPKLGISIPAEPLGDKTIVLYSIVKRELPYLIPQAEMDVKFEDKLVKGFGANTEHRKLGVQILSYDTDDRFIVSIMLRNGEDQLILAKGYPMASPDTMLVNVLTARALKPNLMGSYDRFEAPKIDLNYNRNYFDGKELFFLNQAFDGYNLPIMAEYIEFHMDAHGVKLEAKFGPQPTPAGFPSKPKNLLLNKPFWIVLMRDNTSRPYFILGVRNTRLMTHVKP